MAEVLTNKKPSVLLTLYGLNSDSGNHSKEICFEGIQNFEINRDLLHHEISEW